MNLMLSVELHLWVPIGVKNACSNQLLNFFLSDIKELSFLFKLITLKLKLIHGIPHSSYLGFKFKYPV